MIELTFECIVHIYHVRKRLAEIRRGEDGGN